MKKLLLPAGLIIILAVEILRVYFIMPFPGSQHRNTIDLAYFIDRYRLYLRMLGLLLVIFPLYHYFVKGKRWSKVLLSAVT